MIFVLKFPYERGRRGGFRFGEWNGAWDPEGLLSTLPAIGTCLLGVFAGLLLKEPRPQPHQKTLWLIGSGAVMIALGVASHVPIEPRRARRTVINRRKSQKPSGLRPSFVFLAKPTASKSTRKGIGTDMANLRPHLAGAILAGQIREKVTIPIEVPLTEDEP